MGARPSREVGNFLCGARVTVASHEVRAWYRAVQDTACAAEGDAAPWAARSFSLIAVGFWAVQAGFGRSPSLVHVAARVTQRRMVKAMAAISTWPAAFARPRSG